MNKKPDLPAIYRRTGGRCHLCYSKLTLKHYGRIGIAGCWEIEHSIPRAKGGTDRKNNLYAACVVCNRSKGARTTSSARRKNGHTRAPYSRAKKVEVRRSNVIAGAAAGAGLGLLLGPGGWLLGAIAGAVCGDGMRVR